MTPPRARPRDTHHTWKRGEPARACSWQWPRTAPRMRCVMQCVWRCLRRRMVYEERMASNEQNRATGVARLVEIPMRARTVEDFDTTFRDSFAVRQ